MTSSASEPASELVEYFWMFWRRKWLMLLVVVLVVGPAVYYSSQQTKVYESSASVLVRFVNLQPTRGSDTGLINMEPERGRATSAEVAALAATAALLPAAVLGGREGLEVVQAVAFVALGGLASTTVVSLFVVPVLVYRFGPTAEPEAVAVSIEEAREPETVGAGM